MEQSCNYVRPESGSANSRHLHVSAGLTHFLLELFVGIAKCGLKEKETGLWEDVEESGHG